MSKNGLITIFNHFRDKPARGETCKQALYFHLEKNFKLNKRDIPFRIEDFTEAIENIFGVGAKVLQIRIMKNLFKKMGYPFPYLHDRECLEFKVSRISKSQLEPLVLLQGIKNK